jgi:hypothetical protein
VAHLQYHTGVKRKKLKAWLDEMVADGVLELEVDDDGEMLWQVPGAKRPPEGARTFAELERVEALRSQAKAKVGRGRDGELGGMDVARQALTLAGRAQNALDRPRAEGDKSLLASAGLSLLGPIGWLYAGSFKEAVPAVVAQLLIASIVPSFLLMPLLLVLLPLSSLAGLIYAWQYNKKGQRTTIFLGDKSSSE